MARKMNLARMGMLSIYLLTNVFCAHAGELSFWETRRAAVNRRIGDYAAKDDIRCFLVAGAERNRAFSGGGA
jgi:molybdopterin synthase catalytic subunit